MFKTRTPLDFWQWKTKLALPVLHENLSHLSLGSGRRSPAVPEFPVFLQWFINYATCPNKLNPVYTQGCFFNSHTLPSETIRHKVEFICVTLSHNESNLQWVISGDLRRLCYLRSFTGKCWTTGPKLERSDIHLMAVADPCLYPSTSQEWEGDLCPLLEDLTSR